MQVQRVSKVNIKPKHEYYDYLKYLCRVSKNLYNTALFIQRQAYFDNDVIPIYKSKETKHKFSGQRIKRGLYRTKEGKLINADVNGSLNILRKSKVTDDVVRPVSIGRVANPVKINIF